MLNKTIKTSTPTNRLIIGDVGSGKTLVALMSLLAYLESFYNALQTQSKNSKTEPTSVCVAFMAPTEVLAAQHYQKLIELVKLFELNWLDTLYISNKSKLLNNEKLTPKSLEKYLDQVETKNPETKFSFWVGTQALLFLKNFNPLMVVADEQHRFGVNQRQNLSNVISSLDQNQSQIAAHYISMTATPIPRTLALTIYGDLKASYIKKIETRNPIYTEIVNLEQFENKVLTILKNKLLEKQKVFVICPSIEEQDENQNIPTNPLRSPADSTGEQNVSELWNLKSAKEFLEQYFDSESISTLHGKLAKKDDILNEFKESKTLQILISTTVIEVGVDVSEASIILIFNPERFGLAQLHQIRGRVGRNNYAENYCFMLAGSKGIQFLPRLKFLCQSQDGFEIAQEDLRLRGQGDLYGTTQSGQMEDLLGLDTRQYTEIRKIVQNLDIENLESEYPKLQKYLVESSNRVWGE